MKRQPFYKRLNEAMNIREMKQVDLVEKTKIGKSAISQYSSGIYEPKQKALYKIASALDVSEAWLMGYDVPMDRNEEEIYPDNILKIETRQFPVLGDIAAGIPIFAEEQFDSYVEAGTNIHADFCLKVKGDSMINARICNGDIVFIRKQEVIQYDGQIAAVLIGEEATLKRVYMKENELVLISENPSYAPLVYKNQELESIRILGVAIAFQSDIK